MIKFAAFLRGINVAGQKSIKMAELKAMMIALDYQDVSTYIQSGNILFQSGVLSREKHEIKIKEAIETTFGFDVTVVVRTCKYIGDKIKSNPYLEEKSEVLRLYYTLLAEVPQAEFVEKLYALADDIDLYTVSENIIYIHVKTKYSDSKFSNNLIEKVLKVKATTRNHATMVRMSD